MLGRRYQLTVLAVTAVAFVGPAQGGHLAAAPSWRMVAEHHDAHGHVVGLDLLTSGRSTPRLLVRWHSIDGWSFPRMSPDGFHVAYVFYTSHRPGRNGLYVVDLGRGKPQRVAAGNARNIAWSPDSTEIAFSGQSSGKRPGIFVVSSTGGAARRVFPANGFPNWSPDGRQIVCSCGFREEVWVFSSDGEGARRLAGPVPRKVAAAAVFGVTGASWSPDGRLIAFGRNCYLIEIVSDIWCEPAVMDPDGKNKRTVRKETTFFAGYPPVWSSPGSMLLQTWRLRAKPVMSLNVRTGARRVFYAVRSTVYQYALWASTRHTAFATVDGTKLVLLDPSGRVLGKRRLPRPLVFKYGYFPFNGDVWLGETR